MPKSAGPVKQVLGIARFFLSGRPRPASPYQQFYRAARWFWRMKRKGELPPPYGPQAEPVEVPTGFGEEPKPKSWKPGGTARRARERAKSKAEHRAERLARYRAERLSRIQSRMHKPLLTKLGILPPPEPPAS